eukprot:CAMPEP_0181222142 /NCGR_PEP_ID=MMETSP1096-20121128/29801_1 /TAXON_ID=156174 ORGANISM="Chrysochromulina ericina, Strain CCMP281" /NCGR_SAMPLE_ID=MMETSP1096 /ASSEMBLY_ACC=CAM_ASM_000453 /LENGTH=131 /DNA_ID=CAMNT_0023314869 /DNA_START=138 /DNA_END=530 /DNA_ORIENTATION=+
MPRRQDEVRALRACALRTTRERHNPARSTILNASQAYAYIVAGGGGGLVNRVRAVRRSEPHLNLRVCRPRELTNLQLDGWRAFRPTTAPHTAAIAAAAAAIATAAAAASAAAAVATAAAATAVAAVAAVAA